MGVKREDWKYVNLGIGGNDVVRFTPASHRVKTADIILL